MKEIKRIYCNGTMKVERIDKEYSVCVCNKCGNYEEIDNSLINNKNNIKCCYVTVVYDDKEKETFRDL